MRFGLLLAATLALVTVTPSAMAQTTIIEETRTVSSPTFTLPAGASYIVVDPATGKFVSDYSTRVQIPFGYYVAEKTSGKIVATTDASGNLIAFSTAPATKVLVQVEERRTALEQAIADALAKNTVTVTEIAPMRKALAEVASQEVVLKQSGGTITYAQAAPLAYRLNVIGTQLAPVVRTTALAPILGERVIVDNGAVLVATTDYAARRALLDQRIQFEYDAGRLTNTQVKELREDLSKIANLELKKRRDGTLSSSNMRTIERRFNELSADMQEDISGTNKRRARIGLKVE